MLRLQEEYRSVIAELRSRLHSKAPPPVLDLDSVLPSGDSAPDRAAFSTAFLGTLLENQNHRQSAATDPQGAGLVMAAAAAALTGVNGQPRSQDGPVPEEEEPQTRPSSSGPSVEGSPAGTRGQEVASGDDPAEVGTRRGPRAPLPVRSTTPLAQTEGGRTDQRAATPVPGQTTPLPWTVAAYRRRRSLLHKRQLGGAGACPLRDLIVPSVTSCSLIHCAVQEADERAGWYLTDDRVVFFFYQFVPESQSPPRT